MQSESIDSGSVSCPECGGDVCVLTQIKQPRSHRSRVIPGVIWLIFVLSLASSWVWNGAWVASSRTSDLRDYVGSEFRTAYVPWEPDEGEPVYLSSLDMSRAIEGEEDALRKVTGTLQTIIDRVDAKQGVSGLIGARFSFKEPSASLSVSKSYKLGGEWVLINENYTLQDIRNTHSLKQREGDLWEEISRKYFPELSYTHIKSYTSNFAVLSDFVRVRYLTILGVLSLCVLVAWLIRWAGCCAGVKIVQKRMAIPAMVALLFSVCIAAVLLSQSTTSRRSTISSQSTPISSMFTIEELDQAVLDSDKAIEWCTSVLGLLPANQDEELLLGQLWVFDTAMPKSSHEYTAESVDIQILDEIPLVRWGQSRYGSEVAPEDIQKSARWYQVHSLLNQGEIALQWGSPRQPNYAYVHIVNIALFTVSLYWIWAGLHWSSRRILRRVQRRRIQREQCIFCAYPLTDEALKARYLPDAS